MITPQSNFLFTQQTQGKKKSIEISDESGNANFIHIKSF